MSPKAPNAWEALAERLKGGVSLASLKLKTPLCTGSGTFYAPTYMALGENAKAIGAIVTKTVTPQARTGNPAPRTWELPGIGMLNSIGLQNPGLAAFLDKDLAELAPYKNARKIISISATTSAEFAKMITQMAAHPNAGLIDGLEINLSCPNVKAGGALFGADPKYVAEAITAIAEAQAQSGWQVPTFAKLTPNTGDMVPLGAAALDAGATGLTAINTVNGMAMNIETGKPVFTRVSAGYSGPGIFPIALLAVYKLREAFPTAPIMGVGGITTANDAKAMLLAGATAIQVGTACFKEPSAFATLATELGLLP